MIGWLWMTGLKAGRGRDYEAFARGFPADVSSTVSRASSSLPAFARVSMTTRGTTRLETWKLLEREACRITRVCSAKAHICPMC
jgi:hypothetical protein